MEGGRVAVGTVEMMVVVMEEAMEVATAVAMEETMEAEAMEVAVMEVEGMVVEV